MRVGEALLWSAGGFAVLCIAAVCVVTLVEAWVDMRRDNMNNIRVKYRRPE